MKRILSVTLVVALLLLTAASALADTAYFTSYVLSNGVNGKKNSNAALKSTSTGTYYIVGVTSISGATSNDPMVCNVYNTSNVKVSASKGVYVGEVRHPESAGLDTYGGEIGHL